MELREKIHKLEKFTRKNKNVHKGVKNIAGEIKMLILQMINEKIRESRRREKDKPDGKNTQEGNGKQLTNYRNASVQTDGNSEAKEATKEKGHI